MTAGPNGGSKSINLDVQYVPAEEQQTSPKTKGTSAVQFILTSTIVIHTLDLMNAVYVNVFSCKEFDTEKAAAFTAPTAASTVKASLTQLTYKKD